jgi:hypothetical protein
MCYYLFDKDTKNYDINGIIAANNLIFYLISATRLLQTPAMVAMVDHLMRHTTIDADILTRNETSHVRTQVHHHVCNIHGITHTPRRLLLGICTLIGSVGGVNPAW